VIRPHRAPEFGRRHLQAGVSIKAVHRARDRGVWSI
jgi:hypothetical protein